MTAGRQTGLISLVGWGKGQETPVRIEHITPLVTIQQLLSYFIQGQFKLKAGKLIKLKSNIDKKTTLDLVP